MEASAVQIMKLAIVSATGLSKDALHVHAGFGPFFLAEVAFRKPVGSWTPWGSVFLEPRL